VVLNEPGRAAVQVPAISAAAIPAPITVDRYGGTL
jgi:hypothetical protein